MEVKAQYTEALLRRVTRRFWFRMIGWDGFAVSAVGYLLLICLLVMGNRSWYVGALGAVLFVGTVVGMAVYFVLLRRCLSVLRRMSDSSAVFTFTDAGVAAKTDLGSSELKWPGITKVWVFPEAWLLFVDKGVYITVPTASLPDQARELIRNRVGACGGKVV